MTHEHEDAEAGMAGGSSAGIDLARALMLAQADGDLEKVFSLLTAASGSEVRWALATLLFVQERAAAHDTDPAEAGAQLRRAAADLNDVAVLNQAFQIVDGEAKRGDLHE